MGKRVRSKAKVNDE
jgi:hypothetical protein